MKKTFLCFELEAALFLIPIELVKHILPGKEDDGSQVIYGGNEVCVFELCRLWGGNTGNCGKYMILLNREKSLYGFRVDEVLGIYEIGSTALMEIPKEALGREDSGLKRAAYMESLDSWAFAIEPGSFL